MNEPMKDIRYSYTMNHRFIQSIHHDSWGQTEGSFAYSLESFAYSLHQLSESFAYSLDRLSDFNIMQSI